MAQVPEFLRFHCTSSDTPNCPSCSREFVLPISAAEGFFRTADGHVEIGISGSHFCVDPLCLQTGEGLNSRIRYIKTNLLWNDVMTLLDGAVANIGDITMRQI